MSAVLFPSDCRVWDFLKNMLCFCGCNCDHLLLKLGTILRIQPLNWVGVEDVAYKCLNACRFSACEQASENKLCSLYWAKCVQIWRIRAVVTCLKHILSSIVLLVLHIIEYLRAQIVNFYKLTKGVNFNVTSLVYYFDVIAILCVGTGTCKNITNEGVLTGET